MEHKEREIDTEEIIHIQWDGPMSFEDITKDRKYTTAIDYGIYQVCGPHPSYGSNKLLYIGRAQKRTFGVRLTEEGWIHWQLTNGTVVVYLGRISGSFTPDNDTWNAQIDRAERLLILAHRPSHNSKGLNRNNDPNVGSLHILNWGDRGALLPEVSGARWSSRFAAIDKYGPYSSNSLSPMSEETVIAQGTEGEDDRADL